MCARSADAIPVKIWRLRSVTYEMYFLSGFGITICRTTLVSMSETPNKMPPSKGAYTYVCTYVGNILISHLGGLMKMLCTYVRT